MKTDRKLIENPAYLWGHILATQATVVALAQLMGCDREEFAAAAGSQIEALRTAALPESVPEPFLLALDHAEAQMRSLYGLPPDRR